MPSTVPEPHLDAPSQALAARPLRSLRPINVALVGECMLELQGEAFGVMQQSFGGDTLNTAVYLARCGAHTGVRACYVTALGDDAFSAGLLERWVAEGVGVQWVRRLPGRLPGLYLIEVDPLGERRFSYWRDSAAARSLFDTEQTPLEGNLDQVDLLYLSGISLAILPPAGRERLFAMMRALRGRGARVAFDSNYRPRLWPDRAQALACYDRAYALADLAFVSLDDEVALRGAADRESVLALPVAELVLKCGSASTWVRLPDGRRLELPVLPVVPVDTTAAGDSFAGAYLALRLAGAAPRHSAEFANQLAGRVIQHRGAVVPAAAMADLLQGLAAGFHADPSATAQVEP
jgi:2-dehydro-3-deoxygluconokinase